MLSGWGSIIEDSKGDAMDETGLVSRWQLLKLSDAYPGVQYTALSTSGNAESKKTNRERQEKK